MKEGWKKVLLSDYYDVRSGLSKPASEFGRGFPFLSFKTVFNNYFIPDEITDLVNSTEAERNLGSIKKGDVFLTRTSETNDELGMSCVALKDYPNATFNGFTKRLRPKDNNHFDAKYIGFYLRSPEFRSEINSYSNLTTRASLNNEIIGRLHLVIPPLHIQHKIAGILSAYDDLIENNLKRINLLEEMASQTYNEWFARLHFPGYEHEHNLDSPEKWKKLKIKELCTLVNGFPFKSSTYKPVGAYSIVTIKNVQDGKFDDAKFDFIDDLPSNIKPGQILKQGDLIMSLTGNVGRICFVVGDYKLLNQRVCKIQPLNPLNISFISNLFRSKKFRSSLENLSNGVAQQNLSTKDVENIEVMVPSEALLDKFAEMFNPSIQLSLNLQNQNQLLKEARDFLLPRLMTGMINVGDLENAVITQ